MTPLTDAEIRDRLAPGETADDVLLVVLAALRRAGHDVAVTDAYGVGAEVAAELHLDGGRRVRLTAQEW
ncbi:hypothetical protein SUDANB121_05958 (plasmid) [Nocardiopsis dassonvillei]|uniref:hypothetical protein n=1 Tax=Nocardiopsis dassonvillei TaxID=2014 RepID=UPI003F55774A